MGERGDHAAAGRDPEGVALIYLHLPEEPEPIPVTNLFGADGEPVVDWDEAMHFVAGPLASGKWISGLRDDFRARPLN